MFTVEWLEAARDDAREWSEGRSPWSRAVLLAYLVYAGLQHVASGIGGEYRSWFAGITLAFHELGHVLFAPLGHTSMLLGGSILQLAIPALAGLYLLLRQHDWFGLSVCGVWLSTSLFELATYIDDANRGNLPLVGLGDDVIHDWDALLTQWHLLNQAQTLARSTHALGLLTLVCSIAFGAWLLVEMWKARSACVR